MHIFKTPFTAFMLIMFSGLGISAQAADTTLDIVKKRGHLKCGVSQGLPGFSNPDSKGNWTGIDVDLCRGVAAAIFADADKVKFTPLSAKERFIALQSGEVDIVSRNTTWSMHRDTAMGVDFPAITYFDGQGFMVRRSLGLKSSLELDGATICTNQGTTTELNAADYFRSNNLEYEIVAFEKSDEAVSAYNTGRCDAYTTDHSALYAHRLKLTDPSEHEVLPEVISKEPLSPVVRQGDDQWGDIVKWVHYAMVAGEELKVHSGNVDEMNKSKNPAIRRLLGYDGTFGANLGIPADWAQHIIREVGNYSEVYDRNVGENTPLAIKRGRNALWTEEGGLMYAPPIR